MEIKLTPVDEKGEDEPSKVPKAKASKSDIMDSIGTVEEVADKVRVLVYGNPGVGKTVFGATAPNPLFLDVERGTISLRNHPEYAKTKVLPIKAFSDLYDLFWKIQEGHPFFDSIDTFVLDTVSELQKKQMDELLKQAAKRDKNRNPYLPFQADYKENTEAIRRLILAFLDIDKHLIILCHAMEDKDDTGTIIMRPAVTPKLSGTLEGIVDVLGHMTAEMDDKGGIEKRYLQVAPSRRVKAKTRLGGLPGMIENPTFTMFLDKEKDA